MRHHRFTIAVGIILVSAMACSGASESVVLDPFGQALERSETVVDNALDRALQAEEAVEWLTFRARYNPAPCDCPSWEIIYRGRWSRVYLAVDAQQPLPLDDLRAQAERDLEEGRYTDYTIVGRFEGEWTLVEATGMRYQTFLVNDLTRTPTDTEP